MLQDCLEVRGLGVLNVREMFGDTAVKRNKYLRLIVHLGPSVADGQLDGMKRLYGDVSTIKVLEVEVPRLVIPVAPGPQPGGAGRGRGAQPCAQEQGHRCRADFVDRQAHSMKRQRTW